MSSVCQVTGRKPGYGKRVSHSHHRSSRRWEPNVQKRWYWVPSLGRSVRLTVSTKGIKLIDKRGIDAIVNDLRQQGVRV